MHVRRFFVYSGSRAELFTGIVTPEQRANAVVAHFEQQLPPIVRADLESVIARSIRRALNEQLARLEREAEQKVNGAQGRGKQAKGRDEAAIHFHSKWARRFKELRTGRTPPDPLDLLASATNNGIETNP
jgi:hypothetical protein